MRMFYSIANDNGAQHRRRPDATLGTCKTPPNNITQITDIGSHNCDAPVIIQNFKPNYLRSKTIVETVIMSQPAKDFKLL